MAFWWHRWNIFLNYPPVIISWPPNNNLRPPVIMWSPLVNNWWPPNDKWRPSVNIWRTPVNNSRPPVIRRRPPVNIPMPTVIMWGPPDNHRHYHDHYLCHHQRYYIILSIIIIVIFSTIIIRITIIVIVVLIITIVIIIIKIDDIFGFQPTCNWLVFWCSNFGRTVIPVKVKPLYVTTNNTLLYKENIMNYLCIKMKWYQGPFQYEDGLSIRPDYYITIFTSWRELL